jgi:hypothetical protein
LNIAMRDVPPCVIPETKHWRNTPPRSQQCVLRIQQYGRREKNQAYYYILSHEYNASLHSAG